MQLHHVAHLHLLYNCMYPLTLRLRKSFPFQFVVFSIRTLRVAELIERTPSIPLDGGSGRGARALAGAVHGRPRRRTEPRGNHLATSPPASTARGDSELRLRHRVLRAQRGALRLEAAREREQPRARRTVAHRDAREQLAQRRVVLAPP